MTRHPRTINYAALGWLAVAALAAIALILVAPLAWHATVALWTSGAAWWLAAVVGFVVTGGSLSVAYKRAEENIDLRGRVYELEADVRDLTAALAEATAKSAANVHYLRIPEQRMPADWWPWLDNALDEQAETWPTDGGAS